MRNIRIHAAAFAAALFFATGACAVEIHVMISGGLHSAYAALLPEFEQRTGHKVVTARGPSMGDTKEAIPNRIAHGEPVDVVIMVSDALAALVAAGKVDPTSRVDIANSPIAMAVKAGEAKPDISTVEKLRLAFLDAKSIAYSDSASGVYIQDTLLPRLGIADQVRGKARMIPGEPVGRVVARGEAQIGFQQVSELRAVPGVEIVGVLPEGAQKITTFSAGIATGAREAQAGKQLIDFLTSERGKAEIRKTGLDPLGAL